MPAAQADVQEIPEGQPQEMAATALAPIDRSHHGLMQVAQMNDGVNLIIPNLKLLEERVAVFSAQLADVQSSLIQKVNSSTVDQLQQKLHKLEHSALTSKADSSEVSQLGLQVHAIGARLSQKAEAATVERIGEQLQALTGSVVTKVDVEVLDGKLAMQAERILENTRNMMNKVDTSDFDSKWRTLQMAVSDLQTSTSVALASLEKTVATMGAENAQRADASEVAQLRGQVQEACAAANRKAEASVVEQLFAQHRQLTASLQQKAEHAELESLKGRVSEVKAMVLLKAEHAEVDRLSVLLEGLTHGLCNTLDKKIEERFLVVMKDQLGSITVDLKAIHSELSVLKSDGSMLNDKVSQFAVDLSRKAEKTLVDALAAEKASKAAVSQVAAELKAEKDSAEKLASDIKAKMTSEVSAIRSAQGESADLVKRIGALSVSLDALTMEKADKSSVDKLASDIKVKVTSEVSAVLSTRGESADLVKRIGELSVQVALKADKGRVEGFAQALRELKEELGSEVPMATTGLNQMSYNTGQNLDSTRLSLGGNQACSNVGVADLVKRIRELSVQVALKADKGRVEAFEQALRDLKEELGSEPMATTGFNQMSYTTGQNLDSPHLSLGSNQARSTVGVRLCRLIELLVSATDPRSNGVVRVGGGYQFNDDVSLFDKSTHQAMYDLLQLCSGTQPRLEAGSSAIIAPVQTNADPTLLPGQANPRIDSMEKKLTEVSNIVALKANADDVGRLATQLAALSDGTLTQALRTQRVVSRPTSARGTASNGRRPVLSVVGSSENLRCASNSRSY